MSTTLTFPIVGSHFRPPAKQILTVLPVGYPLHLQPELDNPYDPNAIQVRVSLLDFPVSRFAILTSALEGTGYDPHDLIAAERSTGETLHLGYIPKSGAKTCKGGPGNRELIQAIASPLGDRLFTARLSLDADGSPTVVVAVGDHQA